MKIPIVMVSDKNYISQTRVAIWTMRKNTNADIFLEITILCAAELGELERARLVELEEKFKNLKIIFVEVDSEIFRNSKPVGHIPITSFYRLIIADIMKEEKCLFLDGDILVYTDLEKLYQEDVEDYYIAGVKDIGFRINPDWAVSHAEKCGFESLSNYVNAGVMVFNLVKIRKDGLQEKFLMNMETYYPYMDQDILNMVCQGKIKIIENKYNCFNRVRNNDVDNCDIYHYAGGIKPWRNLRVRGAREWWRWAKEALEENEYEKMYSFALNATRQSDWSYIIKRCESERSIVIVGYSDIGSEVCRGLQYVFGSLKEIMFCDNSERKRQLCGDDIDIYTVEELAEKYTNALWLIVSQKYYVQIYKQIIELGVDNERIITYFHKAKNYYDLLDDEYIDYELEEMRLKGFI